MVASDKHRSWPVLKKWDENSQVYHLNFEAKLMEEQKLATYQMLGQSSDDLVDVMQYYRKLGVFFAKCLLQGYQLVPVSTALVKYLLRDDHTTTYQHALRATYEDFFELQPDAARFMRSSPRTGCDFEDVGLPGIMGLSINTGFQNADFHEPAQPTDDQWDQLAGTVLENNYVMDIMENFKLGFRGVLNLDLGALLAPQEIQMIFAGSFEVDVQNWQDHTIYTGCSTHHPVVKQFWHELRGSSQKQLQAFCQFATGNRTPPVGGFGALAPVFSITVTNSVKAIQAHTCFNLIELPPQMECTAFKLQLKNLADEWA